MTNFSALGLAPQLLRALTTEGYTTPTDIQAQAIGPAMLGRDLLGSAQTGTGKTAAFALPILHRLVTAPVDKARRGPTLPRVVVLSPTRELASQIGESFATYGRHTSLSHVVIFGGVGQFHQANALKRGVDIVVATPGRLIDLMEQGLTNFSAVNVFVLDEADRMLDMGFINPIRRIAATLPKPPARQTLLFSATMPPAIMHLADSLLHNPVKVSVTPVAATTALIEQSVYMVPQARKAALLRHVLASEDVARALVFTRTKHGADRLTRDLHHVGISAVAIHGNKAQNQRTRALDGFRSGRTRVLVATDVAARGLDVDGITHVFNYDLPMEPEAYVHRIGRTGRAGATGIALSFCDGGEYGLLRAIERLIGKKVPQIRTLPEGMDAGMSVPAQDGHPAAAHSRTPHPTHANARPARPAHGAQRGEREPRARWQGHGSTEGRGNSRGTSGSRGRSDSRGRSGSAGHAPSQGRRGGSKGSSGGRRSGR